MCDKCLLPFSPHFFQQFSSFTAEATNPLHPSRPAHPPHPAPPASQFSTDSGFWAHRECKNNPTRSPYLHACVLSCFSCVRLCDSMDCSSPGSSVHGILQARILEWVATPFYPGIEPTSLTSPALAGELYHWSQVGSLITLSTPLQYHQLVCICM